MLTDSSTGLFSNGTNVGIGFDNSAATYGKLDVRGAGYTALAASSSDASGVVGVMAANAASELRLGTISNHTIWLLSNNTRIAILSTTGIAMESGYALSGSGSVPTGGTTNQVLTKSSNTDYALAWATLTI